MLRLAALAGVLVIVARIGFPRSGKWLRLRTPRAKVVARGLHLPNRNATAGLIIGIDQSASA